MMLHVSCCSIRGGRVQRPVLRLEVAGKGRRETLRSGPLQPQMGLPAREA